MLNGGDRDLNLIHSCTDSLTQRLKQTMLNQELAYMRQVYELHQVYRIQIDTMDDPTWIRIDDYNLHKGGMKNRNHQAQYNLADLAPSGNFNWQHERHAHSASMKKPLDLQLSADEFIRRCADDCSERISLKSSVVPNNFSQGIVTSDVDHLKLSLSIGRDSCKKVKDRRSLKANKTCASSAQIIDLEEPYYSSPINGVCLVRAPHLSTPNLTFKDKHKLDSFSQNGRKHVSYGSIGSESVLDVGSSCQRQTTSYSFSGYKGNCREFSCADHLSNNQMVGTCKENNLDLNMAQYEESSCFTNNQSMVHNPSRASLFSSSDSLTSLKKANVIHRFESSDKHRELDLNIDLAHSCVENNGEEQIKEKFRIVEGADICIIDLDSDSGEHSSSSRSNPKVESVDSSLKPTNDLSHNIDLTDAVEADANKEWKEKLESQNQMADENPISHKVLSSSNSDSINDHQSISLKSVAKCEDLNFTCSDESRKAIINPQADLKSPDTTEPNNQCINKKEPAVDEMVQTAAESLVQIFLETRVSHQVGSKREFQDKPQHSSESYERMVLNAKETDPDDFCVSSGAFKVDESENKCSRYKLKRGTRMKDFQKDILPSLSILSRHEISEDINIIEGVIRSREYKKMRAKMGDDGDWFRPARNKRYRSGYNRRYNM